MNIMTIRVYDNYNSDKSTTVIATERKSARPWIEWHNDLKWVRVREHKEG